MISLIRQYLLTGGLALALLNGCGRDEYQHSSTTEENESKAALEVLDERAREKALSLLRNPYEDYFEHQGFMAKLQDTLLSLKEEKGEKNGEVEDPVLKILKEAYGKSERLATTCLAFFSNDYRAAMERKIKKAAEINKGGKGF